MSDRVAEILQRFGEALAEERVPEELIAPGFVMENVSTVVTNRTYHGPEGVRQWFEDMFGVLEPGFSYEATPVSWNRDWALGRVTISGRGRVSGAPVRLDHWGVLWITDDGVVRAVGYATREQAEAAIARKRSSRA